MDEQEGDRGLLGRGKQLVEQRERGLVRPVEILEHETQRALSRERADELVEPVERLVLDGVAREIAQPLLLLRLERQAEQGGEEGIGLLCLVAERAGELRPQLEADARLGIGDAQTEPAAEQLAHRPVGDRLGVGDGVTGEEAHAPGEALLDSATRRDFPIPGSPVIETIAPLPSSSPSRASLSVASSCSRPTSGGSGCAAVCARIPATRKAATGSLLPFNSRSPSCHELEQPVDLVRRRRPHDEIAQRLQARGHVDRCRRARCRGRAAARRPPEPRPGPC